MRTSETSVDAFSVESCAVRTSSPATQPGDHRIRVLHVIPNLGNGGAERVLLTLICEQQSQGLDPRLCVLGDQNAFPERLEGIPVQFLGFSGSMRDVVSLWRCVRGLRRLIREQAPDVVHTHLWPAARLTAVACAGLPAPLLVHIHDTRPWLAGSELRDRMMRLVTRTAMLANKHSFVAVSDAARRYTQDHLPWLRGPIPVVPNAFDPREFSSGTAETTEAYACGNGGAAAARTQIIGTAGRFSPEKGHEHLIRAVDLLRSRGMDLKLRIAGDGGLRPRYEQLIDELHLGDHVELPGKVEDMAPFYRTLDVYVQPSEAEGMPIVLLEAMAMGLPIVATAVGGAGEAIRDGKDGLLVAPADPVGLADAVQRLVDRPDLRRSLGRSAFERVMTEFTGSRMAEQLTRIYRQITAPGMRRGPAA